MWYLLFISLNVGRFSERSVLSYYTKGFFGGCFWLFVLFCQSGSLLISYLNFASECLHCTFPLVQRLCTEKRAFCELLPISPFEVFLVSTGELLVCLPLINTWLISSRFEKRHIGYHYKHKLLD